MVYHCEMNEVTIQEWLNEYQQNFKVWRIQREDFQLNLDTVVAIWQNSGYADANLPAVKQSIEAFCEYHNFPEPKAGK